MKITLLLMLFLNMNLIAQWDWLNPSPIGNPIESGFFVNENIGWIVGASGSIIKTTNGGIEWEFQECGSETWFKAVYFIDENTGWIAGDGNILHTINSGENWDTIEAANYSSYENLYFKDSQNGWITGYEHSLVTTNGGESWSLFNIDSSSHFGPVYFIDSNIGWIAGEKEIFRTDDGGISWEKIILQYDDRLYLGGLFFLNEQYGWITERDGSILYTSDGGDNWNKRNIVLSNYDFYSIHFIDNNNGFVVGPFTGFYRTTDGGTSWQKYKDIYGVNIYANKIIFHDNFAGWLVGNNGKIYKTDDSGFSWERLTNDFSLSFINGDEVVNIKFIDQNNGFLLGNDWTYPYSGSEGKSHILNTTNGGISWEESFLSKYHYLNSLYYNNSNIFWAAGDSAVFLKSVNNGISWEEYNLSSQSVGDINDIFFITDQIGWLSGSGIFKTTDGGTNWESTWQGEGITSIYFNDVNNGWFCNSDGAIYHSSNGGLSWNFQIFTYTKLNKIVFKNDIGIAVGEVIEVTTDGGGSWEQMNLPGNIRELYDVYFLSDSVIVSTGSTGCIIISNNGGRNWKDLFKHIYYDIFCIDRIENSIWIGGQRGALLSTKLDNILNVDQHNKSGIINKDFHLHQNYPNPFNPTTNIKFEIPSTKFVSIDVYDVLGNKIATLLNNEKKAGIYNISFNASNLSSGIYFYSLRTDDFVQTKKMILIK